MLAAGAASVAQESPAGPSDPPAPPAQPANAAKTTADADANGPASIALFAGVLVVLGAGAAGMRAATRDTASDQSRATRTLSATQRNSSLISALVYGLSAVIGVAALLYPFLAAAIRPSHWGAGRAERAGTDAGAAGRLLRRPAARSAGSGRQRQTDRAVGCIGGHQLGASLRGGRYPGPGGFSPIFVLIILTGYVFGGRFGFLMGTLTMLVSGVFTGGVGPWLPAQMFTAGWVGLSAPLARPLVRLTAGRQGSRHEVVVLAVFAGVWGLLFGAIMNLWFWPFMAGPADQYWQAGITLGETAGRYLAYYLATSLIWDALLVVGNAGLMLVFGAATLRTLRRFGHRFTYEYQPEPTPLPQPAGADAACLPPPRCNQPPTRASR